METKRSHRGVAPIIATLLMVAIAVVGGVLIYVYTQGFFASTQSATVSTDIITMTGYDGVGGNTLYTGAAITDTGVVGDADNTNGKLAGEPIALHIRNSGGSPVQITSVKVDGLRKTIETVGLLANFADDEWALYTAVAAPISASEPTVPANEEATIVYLAGAAIGSGQQVTFEVGTKSGAAFTFKVFENQRK